MTHTTHGCDIAGCAKPHRARGYCSTHYNQRVMSRDARHPRVRVACCVCDTTVVRGMSDRYRPTCSFECRTIATFGKPKSGPNYDWTIDAMNRAARAGATILHPIDRLAVFERDDWRCYMCDTTVHLDNRYALTSATVDHVVPLSRGGAHAMNNVATCCLACNSAKQDRPAGHVAAHAA